MIANNFITYREYGVAVGYLQFALTKADPKRLPKVSNRPRLCSLLLLVAAAFAMLFFRFSSRFSLSFPTQHFRLLVLHVLLVLCLRLFPLHIHIHSGSANTDRTSALQANPSRNSSSLNANTSRKCTISRKQTGFIRDLEAVNCNSFIRFSLQCKLLYVRCTRA